MCKNIDYVTHQMVECPKLRQESHKENVHFKACAPYAQTIHHYIYIENQSCVYFLNLFCITIERRLQSMQVKLQYIFF